MQLESPAPSAPDAGFPKAQSQKPKAVVQAVPEAESRKPETGVSEDEAGAQSLVNLRVLSGKRVSAVPEAGSRKPEAGFSVPKAQSQKPKAQPANSFIRNILLASPSFAIFYTDYILANFPNSNEAKILRPQYQKILEKVNQMAQVSSCTHIKITGVRCGSPTLHGEQFCYFHQHAHRGVRKPKSRLHPISILEDPESIQASLMEVVNGLMRNTLDTKRAELIIRALHIAMKNVRHVSFSLKMRPVVREIPDFEAHDAARAKTNAFVTEHMGTAAPGAADALPAVAAIDPRPVDPNDPDFWERMERGGQVLKREAAERQAAEAARAAAADAKPAPAVPSHNFKPQPAPPKTTGPITKTTAPTITANAEPSRKPPAPTPRSGNGYFHRSQATTPNKKPVASAKQIREAAQSVAPKEMLAPKKLPIPAPKERKNAAQRASAG
jgi:hypothetical protein